jgi:flagellar basal body-associated protein FliL
MTAKSSLISAGLLTSLLVLSTLALIISASLSYMRSLDPQPKPTLIEEKAKATEWIVRQLPTIVTNIADPQSVWIRLDLHVRVKSKAILTFEDMRALIADDVLSYLRSVNIEELEGDLGLLALRSEILDRFHFRMGNDVSNVMISTFVVQ